jgi:SAM-dependent methyltransferase
VDVSARQLAVAHRLQGEFGLRFPLVQADAERVPLGAGCAGLVISEYGASVWCDPYRWIPQAARLLRPGGRLVFMAQSTLARLCMPEEGPATDRLVRDLFGLHRVVRRGTSGSEYQLFALPHGEWIRLLGPVRPGGEGHDRRPQGPAGLGKDPTSGRCGSSRRALAMHKKTTSPLSARPWSGLPSVRRALHNRGPSRRYKRLAGRDPSWFGPRRNS